MFAKYLIKRKFIFNLLISSPLDTCTALDIIEEDEEYVSDDEIFEDKNSDPVAMSYSNVRDKDFPQAFSHYLYEKSKKNLW